MISLFDSSIKNNQIQIGLVDVYIPTVSTVELTHMEFVKLVNEYSDMLLEINGHRNLYPYNPQYQANDTYNSILIKDIISKIDGNFEALKFQTKITSKSAKVVPPSEDNSLKLSYTIKYLKKVARLGEGASFGELSIFTSKPRAATIKAVRKTDLATLNKDQFTSILGKVEKAQKDK